MGGMAREPTMFDREHWRPPPRLRDLPNHGVTHIWCWCNRCHHNDMVSLAMLMVRFGMDLPFPSIHGRLRCAACGSK
jgi:hypothetical protein